MATIKILDRLHISFSHRHVPAHHYISRDKMDIWARANNDCATDAKAFWKKEEASGILVTSTDLCYEPWLLWIKGETFYSSVKGNMYTFIHDPAEASKWDSRDLPDT
jgi:hypothetical protein